MRNGFSIVLLVITVIFGRLSAQEYNDDAALWLTLNAEKKVSERLNLHLGQQVRINNNFADAGQFTTTLGSEYKVRKGIRIAAEYAFRQRRRLDASYSLRHQFFVSVFLRKKVQRFTFVYRNRTQAQYTDWLNSEEGKQPELYNRNKLTVKRELNKKWETYIAGEINLPVFRPERMTVDRSRLFIGMIYTLSRQLELETYFMLQKRFSYTNQPRRDFIYGITVNYTF